MAALKKIKNGYIGGARSGFVEILSIFFALNINSFFFLLFYRVVMGNISDFSSYTSVSKLEFQDESTKELLAAVGVMPRSLPQDMAAFCDSGR